MEKRIRSKDTFGLPGTVYTVSGSTETILGTSIPLLIELDSEDFWKKSVREDNTLPPSAAIISEHFRDPYCMNRSTGTFRFRNHQVDNPGFTSVGGLNNVRPAPDSAARVIENNSLALELLAKTNPFRYEYSIPVAIKELVDVASLFKFAAGSFAGMVGGGYLNYKFGWTQFERDMRTLRTITVAIERRIKEFDSLSKSGGLRRKVHLLNKSKAFFEANRLVQSSWGVSVTVDVTGGWSCKTHGTVRWRVKDGFTLNLTKLEAFNAAVSQVFDLGELDAQTVWNMIPFSWLVDYFIDLDSVFGANQGQMFIEPYDISIVRVSRSRFKQQVKSKTASISLTGTGKHSRNHYERDIVSAGSLTLPGISFLSRDQMLTVAALLAVLREGMRH